MFYYVIMYYLKASNTDGNCRPKPFKLNTPFQCLFNKKYFLYNLFYIVLYYLKA